MIDEIKKNINYYNINYLIVIFDKYKKNLEELKKIEYNDKLSFDDNDNIYIDKSNPLQFIKRWYYNENREKTYKILKKKLLDYEKYLSSVIYNLYKVKNTEKIKKYGEEIIMFNKEILEGLNNLYKTYEDKENKLLELLKKIIEKIKLNNEEIKRKLNK
jgi:hypothetical protein